MEGSCRTPASAGVCPGCLLRITLGPTGCAWPGSHSLRNNEEMPLWPALWVTGWTLKGDRGLANAKKRNWKGKGSHWELSLLLLLENVHPTYFPTTRDTGRWGLWYYCSQDSWGGWGVGGHWGRVKAAVYHGQGEASCRTCWSQASSSGKMWPPSFLYPGLQRPSCQMKQFFHKAHHMPFLCWWWHQWEGNA